MNKNKHNGVRLSKDNPVPLTSEAKASPPFHKESTEGRDIKGRDILFRLSKAMAIIRGRDALDSFIENELKKVFAFDDMVVMLVDNEKSRLQAVIKYFEYERIIRPEYRYLLTGGTSDCNDGISDVTIRAQKPQSWLLDDIITWDKVPPYIRVFSDNGMKKLVIVPALVNKEVTGLIYFYAQDPDGFIIEDMDLFFVIVQELAVVILNILANEEIQKRDSEKDFLLSLGNDLVQVRTSEQLLSILNQQFKKLPFRQESVLFRLNGDAMTYSTLVVSKLEDAESGKGLEQAFIKKESSISDYLYGFATNAKVAEADLDSLPNDSNTPYRATLKTIGVKKIAAASIYKGSEIAGALVFFSREDDFFFERYFDLISNIAYQLSAVVANLAAIAEIVDTENEKSMLLTISNDMSGIRSKYDMLKILHERLKKIFYFSHTLTTLTDAANQSYTGYIVDPHSISRVHPGYPYITKEIFSLNDPIMKMALSTKGVVVFDLDDYIDRDNIPNWIKMNYDCGIREIVMTSLDAGRLHIGTFSILSDRKNQFLSQQLSIIQGISCQLANAVANIIANEEIAERENEKTVLLSLNSDMAAVRSKYDLQKVINEKLKKLLPVSDILTCLLSEDQKSYRPYLFDPSSECKGHQDYALVMDNIYPIDEAIARLTINAESPVSYDLDELSQRKNLPEYLNVYYECGMKEAVYIAFGNGRQKTGLLIFLLKEKKKLTANVLNLMVGISAQLSIAVANILANEKIEQQICEITKYKQQLESENLYLQEEIQITHNYSEIIGNSQTMREIFQLVSQVSESQSSVLILGETGTGKELIARAIHNSSLRKNKLMVKVNCAALPANLIESELFGHERGSFTGATDRRIGKFELANNSTLFLDEIGELPLDLQVKLLRALQEKEIERVGGRSVIKTDVRIIAATNRDLKKEVAAGNFRSDLYFRLEVFPIMMPALRERKDDIPLLASHFLQKHAKNAKKNTMHISSRAIKQLTAYNWPGNVRELEHMIERSILLSNGQIINEVNLPGRETDLGGETVNLGFKTIEENERDYIMQVLTSCRGRVGGPGGAAEILNLPTSTLNSRIRKLGIKKSYFKD